jgi:hypothetical protein
MTTSTTTTVVPLPINQNINAQASAAAVNISDNTKAAASIMAEIREQASKGAEADQSKLLQLYEKLQAIKANNTTLREAWDILSQIRTSSQTKNG